MQDSVHPQIIALHKLQKQDRRLTALERKLQNIPLQLKEFASDLGKLKSIIDSERDKLEETRAFKLRQERQLGDEENLVRASKTRLGQVKTTRELHATQKELETTRRMITTRTQEIAKLQAAIAATEQRIAKMDESFTQLQTQADQAKDRLTQEQDDLEKAIVKAREARSSLTQNIHKDILRNYERIRKRLGGLAFVAAHRERCTACKMLIPHIVYTQLLKGREILSCESCSRMLYWAGHFPKEFNKLEPEAKEQGE